MRLLKDHFTFMLHILVAKFLTTTTTPQSTYFAKWVDTVGKASVERAHVEGSHLVLQFANAKGPVRWDSGKIVKLLEGAPASLAVPCVWLLAEILSKGLALDTQLTKTFFPSAKGSVPFPFLFSEGVVCCSIPRTLLHKLAGSTYQIRHGRVSTRIQLNSTPKLQRCLVEYLRRAML